MTKLQRNALLVVECDPGLTASQIADLLGTTKAHALRALCVLLRRGSVDFGVATTDHLVYVRAWFPFSMRSPGRRFHEFKMREHEFENAESGSLWVDKAGRTANVLAFDGVRSF